MSQRSSGAGVALKSVFHRLSWAQAEKSIAWFSSSMSVIIKMKLSKQVSIFDNNFSLSILKAANHLPEASSSMADVHLYSLKFVI